MSCHGKVESPHTIKSPEVTLFDTLYHFKVYMRYYGTEKSFLKSVFPIPDSFIKSYCPIPRRFFKLNCDVQRNAGAKHPINNGQSHVSNGWRRCHRKFCYFTTGQYLFMQATRYNMPVSITL